ncbi:hypothetical protein EIN_436420 [Entamoeba invadens IP1]|uniref:Right handed beta helix domain-containing protein n=1 Tax=Entamoeba invadens IP1 TaxID=370355 RepID=A0A0A1U3J1_ENTIV|nr:hypothetical protein EIN_436420 [Entamoeba invadens IP1]ELP88772.1 hypothetical protein EIN_436420 [Entamoeba invadens IP1]|eukprot:XP_004255543.1 hypothetical protein EIN_436420 [Entamoeba invadens IP1]
MDRNINATYDRPIIIRAALNSKVIFETKKGDPFVFNIFNSSNILVVGPFIVRSGTYYTVGARNSTNVTLSNFKIYNSTRWAILVSGLHILVSHNYAEDCVMLNSNCRSTSWTQCYATSAINSYVPILSQNITFLNNEITKSWGEGIDIILASNVLVKGNVITDVFPVQIYVDNSKNVVIEGNVLRDTHREFCSNHTEYHAIAIGNESWPPKLVSTVNITIKNNFIWGTRFGIAYWGTSASAYYSDVTISHNTFFNISSSALAFQNSCVVKGKSVNNQFKNNFIYSNYMWNAAIVNSSEASGWNISSNVYVTDYPKVQSDTWNGTDGNTHSIVFKKKDGNPFKFFQRGFFKNCTEDMYFQSNVETYCFVPNMNSSLYHKGVKVTYTNLENKNNEDFFNCVRSNLNPSIGFSEGNAMCFNSGAIYNKVGIIILSLVILL